MTCWTFLLSSTFCLAFLAVPAVTPIAVYAVCTFLHGAYWRHCRSHVHAALQRGAVRALRAAGI